MFWEVYDTDNKRVVIETEFEYFLRLLYLKNLSTSIDEGFPRFITLVSEGLSNLNINSKLSQQLVSLKENDSCLVNITHLFKSRDIDTYIRDDSFSESAFKEKYKKRLNDLYEQQGSNNITLLGGDNGVTYKTVSLLEVMTSFQKERLSKVVKCIPLELLEREGIFISDVYLLYNDKKYKIFLKFQREKIPF